MSNAPNLHSHRARPTRVDRGARSRALFAGGAAAVVAIAIALGGAVSSSDTATSAGRPAPLARTGEVNAMGLPVVGTPGAASGTAAANGVKVTGANWDLGRVPLDVAVRPTWTLHNTSTAAVTFGEPKAEVRRGCCPGPLTLGTRTAAPGGSTTLTFELAMHLGMDGPHDLGIHVPVESAAGSDHLTLSVAGDFRD